MTLDDLVNSPELMQDYRDLLKDPRFKMLVSVMEHLGRPAMLPDGVITIEKSAICHNENVGYWKCLSLATSLHLLNDDQVQEISATYGYDKILEDQGFPFNRMNPRTQGEPAHAESATRRPGRARRAGKSRTQK